MVLQKKVEDRITNEKVVEKNERKENSVEESKEAKSQIIEQTLAEIGLMIPNILSQPNWRTLDNSFVLMISRNWNSSLSLNLHSSV